MENTNNYRLEIKGELQKKDANMVAKIYAFAALIASVLFGIAAIIAAFNIQA